MKFKDFSCFCEIEHIRCIQFDCHFPFSPIWLNDCWKNQHNKLQNIVKNQKKVTLITSFCVGLGLKVMNHGVEEKVVEKMVKVSREFFRLPENERMKSYSDDPTKTTRLSTSFNVKTEKVANWRDFLRLHCHPLEDYIHEWPTNPPCFRYWYLYWPKKWYWYL